MRASVAFFLLTPVSAVLLVGCGGSERKTPEDETEASAVAVFTVEDGKITLWHQLPSSDSPTETA